MKTTNINFKVDVESRQASEKICSEPGISLSSAFNAYIKKVIRDRAIPFELSSEPEKDPFYDPKNIAYLEDLYQQYKDGKLKIVEHGLIEP